MLIYYFVIQFACHQATCTRTFQNPKARRLHLISAHGYPKEYFFAVTNKGVGGLLKKWGEGASMIRREWKPRNGEAPDGEGSHNEDEDDSESEDEGDRSNRDQKDVGDRAKTFYDVSSDSSIPLVIEDDYEPDPEPHHPSIHDHDHDHDHDPTVDSLTDAMGSLRLIPAKIQFGRGAKRGGFSSQNRHNLAHRMDIDTYGDYSYGHGHAGGASARAGRGGRGKGRGRGRGGGGGAAEGRGGGHSPTASRGEAHHERSERHESTGSVRGLGGGHRSGFPRRGRVIGRMVAARGGRV